KEVALDTAQAAATLIRSMKNVKRGFTLKLRVQFLSTLTALLEPKEADLVTTQAATVLIETMKGKRDSNELRELAQGIRQLAARMHPGEAAQAATIMMQLMREWKAEQMLNSSDYGAGLAALFRRMAPKEAALAAAETASCVKQKLKETKNSFVAT